MARVVVTGAGGRLGRRVVAGLAGQGVQVTALLRRNAPPPPDWPADLVALEIADLADPEARPRLAALCAGADAVIHLAAAMGNDPRRHARDTCQATRALCLAMTARAAAPLLVVAGSVAVLAARGRNSATVIDDSWPVEDRPSARDAYAQAKLAQEQIVQQACRDWGLDATILRIGALTDAPDALCPFVGQKLGPIWLRMGGAGALPVCRPDRAARALIEAALAAPRGIGARLVLEPDLPDRRSVARTLRAAGAIPGAVLPLPWRALLPLADALDAARLWPNRPDILRGGSLRARFAPCRWRSAEEGAA